MQSFASKNKGASSFVLLVGVLVVFAIILAGCGSTTTTTTSSNTLGLITPGTLTVGSDLSYAPQEYTSASGTPTGFDIDLITAVAKQMGLQVKIVNSGFDTIIDSLTAKRFDVVISAVTINKDRQAKVDFVPYFNAGESLMVAKGNPKNITSIEGMCGLKLGVQDGTVEQTDAQAASDACKKAGKPAITMTVLKNETDVIQLLANNRVDATYQDSPVTDYYISQNSGRFDLGGSVVNAAAEGIAVKKGNTALVSAVQKAFTTLKTNGTYDSLFTKWKLDNAQKISLIDRRSRFVA